MTEAAIQKAELICRMEELKRRRELDKVEEELRFGREMLAVQTQLSMFEARMGILDDESDVMSSISSKTVKSKEKVKSWLERNQQEV